eukprot:8158805-Pyramimonas_sp.AAC.1
MDTPGKSDCEHMLEPEAWIKNCSAEGALADKLLNVDMRKSPCLVGRHPKVIASPPGGRLATKTNTLRGAARAVRT